MDSREIPLTQGKVAVVDAADYTWLSRWKWQAHSPNGELWYAIRTDRSKHSSHRLIRMHRLIINAPDEFDVDHINGNGLDNRRSNLRLCNMAENQHNQRPQKGGSSEYKGVCWDNFHNKWKAQIHPRKKHIHLGYFNDEIEAARAYNYAAIRLYGEFARLNQIESDNHQ